MKKLAIAALLLATACGGKEATVRSGAPVDRPTAPTEVVVQVLVGGGFVPIDAAVTTVPIATLLGDGTLITQAAVPAIYPGPALFPLQSVALSQMEVDALVAQADLLGLLKGELAFGQPSVADAPSTTVTIAAHGAIHRHDAYALGMDGFGLSGREAANRKALSTFVDAVTGLRPGDEAWAPPAVAVYTLGRYTADPQLPQTPVAWPLRQPPPAADPSRTPRSCLLVEGADLATLTPVLARANAITPWLVNGAQTALAFRPVVPGQPGCP